MNFWITFIVNSSIKNSFSFKQTPGLSWLMSIIFIY
jgi:hypothetical protein